VYLGKKKEEGQNSIEGSETSSGESSAEDRKGTKKWPDFQQRKETFFKKQ